MWGGTGAQQCGSARLFSGWQACGPMKLSLLGEAGCGVCRDSWLLFSREMMWGPVLGCAAADLQWLASVWPHEVEFSWEKQDGFVEIPGFWFLGGIDVGGTGAQQRSSAWIFGGRQVCP